MAISTQPFVPGRRALLFQLALGLSIVIALCAYVVLALDLALLQRAFQVLPQNPATVALMALVYTAAFWLRAMAWRALLGNRISTGKLFSILQASLFVNHAAPFKAGEIVRPYLATRHGLSVDEAATSTVVARLLDFAALASIAAVAVPLGVLSPALALPVAGVACAILAASTLLVVLRERVPANLPPAVMDLATRAQASLRAISARKVGAAAPLVLASWLLEAGVLYGTARLLDADVSLTVAIGATAFTILFQVVHLTPGGLGVYETSMASVLALHGLGAEEALTLALVTHGFKFAYSFTLSAPFTVREAVSALQGRSDRPKTASRIEIVVARTWNVFNEGKPFTPVFALLVLLVLSVPHAFDVAYWPRFGAAVLVMTPLALVFFRFDFPLYLRAALWVYLVLFLAAFRYVDVVAVGVVAGLYLAFTVFMWGTVYYHLRIGTPWTNFLRFWRLVLENPDPTSGNFQEQMPKLLMLVLGAGFLMDNLSAGSVAGMQVFALLAAAGAVLVHQWFFRWVPALPVSPSPVRATFTPALSLEGEGADEAAGRVSRRFIVIAIDGCRADRLLEANTPFIDRLRREGADFTDVSTVYPARTVTCFASMLTGAPPAVHGMRSNFVPSLGVKCDSVFESLRRSGLNGKLVGIAHLIDAFGDDVQTVTAVMDNDDIDDGLIAQAKAVMTEDAPDLLVLQLLSVDQTGHARGSYYPEYLRKIEVTDRKIEAFLGWCRDAGYLDGATVLITADHGQGIGIGGHGHMSPTEIHVPCILWGAGVPEGVVAPEARFVTDIAPTVTSFLGVDVPTQSVGTPLLPLAPDDEYRPAVFVIPARNEAQNLPELLGRLQATAPPRTEVVVVDDGSTDQTAAIAQAHAARVVRHETNRGLGAALRTGLLEARRLNARAAVYLDADLEYDPAEAYRLLGPIERGEADYVLGSRFLRPEDPVLRVSTSGTPRMRLSRRIANRCFSVLLSVLCGRWVSDGQTGYRAFSERAIAVAEIVHDYNYAQVLTLDLLRKGMRMKEVPVTYRPRRHGKSFISLQYLWRVPLGMAREMLAD
jgi:uncharacterized membrane protein YbhN (UPF0104 family)